MATTRPSFSVRVLYIWSDSTAGIRLQQPNLDLFRTNLLASFKQPSSTATKSPQHVSTGESEQTPFPLEY